MALETARLKLQLLRLADAEALFEILGSTADRRYTFSLSDVRDCRRHIAGHECQRRKVGYGPWVIVEKASQKLVGFGGVYDDPFDPGWGPEVGYHFARSAWGRGYATELTRCAVRFAHETLKLRTVRAFAHPENKASQAVLRKSGFKLQRQVPGMERLLFAHSTD
tara:strand:- start:80 stop:574 length:495 start_codon:yes stop_codon:yes gene_type:complete